MRTYFDLVNVRRPHVPHALEAFNVALAEITDADGLCAAFGMQPLERQPHLLPGLGTRVRAVDEEQIDVALVVAGGVDLVHRLDALGVALLDAAGGREDLGRDEDFGAWELAFSHRLAHFRLVGVELRRVDVSVPGRQRRQARVDAHAGVGEVDAEAQARDLDAAVGQRQGRGYVEFGHCARSAVVEGWDAGDWRRL